MEKDAKILGVDAELLAEGGLGTIIEEDGTEDLAVPEGQGIECAADFLEVLLGGEHALEVDGSEDGVWYVVFGEGMAEAGTVEFEEDMIADGIDESAEALGLANAGFGTKRGKDTSEGFLAKVFDHIARKAAGTKLDGEQPFEVAKEMLLRRGVA